MSAKLGPPDIEILEAEPIRKPAIDDLLHLADQALYTAKHLGRNLCLLDTGQGRLRTAAGDVVELAESPAVPDAPVFFA